MKRYAYHLIEGGKFIYWDADKSEARYRGDTYAALKVGMQKGEAQAFVREVDVPTTLGPSMSPIWESDSSYCVNVGLAYRR